MTRKTVLLSIFLAAALSACATPASRIGNQQAAFDSYPPEVQQKIRAGQAGIGFTPEQVRMALGEPSTVFTRETDKGSAEVWVYRDGSSGVSFGLGTYSGGNSGIGGGVGVSTGGNGKEKLRLTFEAGRVSSIEQLATKP